MKTDWLQPIDKISLSLMFLLSTAIGLLIWGGKSCGNNCLFNIGPHIQEFSWQNKKIGAEDTAFILTFDRPMDQATVEKNLKINPPLPGKFSWVGRKLAYTLETPAPYGENYEIFLQDAREHFRGNQELGAVMKPFTGTFSTRDRAFVYIGIQGIEQGRLILYNLTQEYKKILTPSNLTVTNFQFYPKGEQILFSATEQRSGIEGLQNLKLYRIKTDLSTIQESANELNKPELILDNKDYQNLQFDLSRDGKTIIVQRLNRQNPNDFDLWMLQDNKIPQRLNTPGGNFLIAPDSQSLAVAQGEGVGILPLKSDTKPLDFLPKFGEILSFSADGSAAAMVDFNKDNAKLRYTRSLFYVNNRGVEKPLLNINGSILNCQFNPNATHLYCLLTQLLTGQEYQEQPYFYEIDLKTAKAIPIAQLPQYQDIQMSLASDGLGILFDQIVTSNQDNPKNTLISNSGSPIVGGQLWFLIPPMLSDSGVTQPQLKELPLVGFRPQWVP